MIGSLDLTNKADSQKTSLLNEKKDIEGLLIRSFKEVEINQKFLKLFN